MANAFMPSVATSLNQAGGMTLQSILEQRLMQQELMAQQQKAQPSILDAISMGLRLKGDQRSEQAARRAADNDAFNRDLKLKEIEAKQLEADAEIRNQRNVAGARDIFATGVQNGADPRDLTRAALDGKVPVSMMPKAEQTLQQKVDERVALRTADKQVDAKFKTPKATKAAKDNPKAPSGFASAIQGRMGTRGFDSAQNAIKSIEARWPEWRKNYPGLDLNAVRATVQNIYGQRVGNGSMDAMEAAIAEAIKSGMASLRDEP